MDLRQVERIERAGLLCWPGIEVEWNGSWVRRSAGGYTKRANSLQCFYPADEADAEIAWAQLLPGSSSRGFLPSCGPPLSRVPHSTRHSTKLTGRRSITAAFSPCPLQPRSPIQKGGLPHRRITPFLAAQQALQGHSDNVMAQMQALLAIMAVRAAGIVIERDGVAVASGLMAVADGMVITGIVIANPTRRIQGFGAAMITVSLGPSRRAP